MQYIISFNQPQHKKETISFEDAIVLKQIADLESKYEKDKETARYLSGKKKGSWGRITQADIKRSEKLTVLHDKIKLLKLKLNSKL